MPPSLSICIPTYNRARYLDEAIASVAMQITDDVELVISDNASTDETGDVIAKWSKAIPSLVYFRWERNMGADNNFLKVVDLAQGEYCWLLGSDDQIKAGGIAAVLSRLGSDDILLVDYVLMTRDMAREIGARKLLRVAPDSRYHICDAKDFSRYLSAVEEMSGLFAYISSIIFRRSKWLALETRSDFIGSNWIHVTKALDIVRTGGRLHYVGMPLVLNRSGNDSFLAEVGYTRRVLINLTYVRIAQGVFARDKAMLEHLLALLDKWFFSWRAILGMRYRVLKDEGENGVRLLEAVLFDSFRGRPQYRLKRALWPFASGVVLNCFYCLDRFFSAAKQRVTLRLR